MGVRDLADIHCGACAHVFCVVFTAEFSHFMQARPDMPYDIPGQPEFCFRGRCRV